MKVNEFRPEQKNVELTVKVLERHIVLDKNDYQVAECLVGDETGTVMLTVKNEQVDLVKPGAYVTVQNGKVDMHKGNMRIVVTAGTGKLQLVNDASFEPKTDFNVSLIEYELVHVGSAMKGGGGS